MKNTMNGQSLVLLGCGKMGSAMLAGWLVDGIDPTAVWVIDPMPSDWVKSTGVHVNKGLPIDPAVVLVAVKPQVMPDALPQLQKLGNGKTIFLSIAAGTTIDSFETLLGRSTPIIRAMPNTPAAVGQGITAIFGNKFISQDQLEIAERLLGSIGQVVRLDHEEQMNAVTGVSGSGPAYVFYLIEALAQAGQEQGLSEALAMQLAKATVLGSGALASQSNESPEKLRINVTSPNGTTQAGLEVLMNHNQGLFQLISKTVEAATNRSKELANG